MGVIKAPYNFVPVNKEVVIPHWGNYISHDIPFKDGHSGSIDLTITAQTPIFVRNGAKERDSSPQEIHRFSQFNGRHFIPATSIKGMLRNVLEIMTFSQMEKVNDHRYAIRDLSPAAKEIYLDHFKAKEIYCGWLRKNSDETYSVEDCGNPGRIAHRDLDAHFDTDFSTYFLKKENGGTFNPKKDREKSARFKYNRFGARKRQQRFQFDRQSAGREIFVVADEESSGERGQIVFTGQPGPRFQKNNRWHGHHLEFIFFEKEALPTLPVDDEVMQNFFFAYYDHDVNRWTEDWSYWRQQLIKEEPIPVFFRKNSDGEIQDLGISFLYKLPYENSVKEAIPQRIKPGAIDLAKAIFGFVDEQGNDDGGLKGRVHIGHAFAEKSEEGEVVTAVLSGPKASYYPNYIRQQVNKGRVVRYQTFMDKHAEIAGWKRYPVRSKISKNDKPENATENVVSRFVPLKSGAEFSCTIQYHNLKTVELGALLSALSFHDTTGTFHSIGMAKPLGYGKVKIELDMSADFFEALQGFEAYMCASLSTAWHQTPQIKDLLAMSSDQNNGGSSTLDYMSLQMRGGNEFKDAKDKHKGGLEALDRYSRLNGVTVPTIKSLVEKKHITEAYEKIQRETRDFQSAENLDDFIQHTVDSEKERFQHALDALKAKLREQLEDQREKVIRERRAAARADIQKQAQEGKPAWDELDLGHGKVFDELKKIIMLFVQDFNSGEKYDKLKSAMPDGVLDAKYHAELEGIILEIVEKASNSERKRWLKPYKKNAYLKKIAEWIGQPAAEALAKKF